MAQDFGKISSGENEIFHNNVEEETCEALLRWLDSNHTNQDIQTWVHADISDPGYQIISDVTIIENVTNPQVAVSDSDDNREPSGADIPTNTEVMEML